MKNTKLIVKTKSKTYPIYFGNNIINKMGGLMKKIVLILTLLLTPWTVMAAGHNTEGEKAKEHAGAIMHFDCNCGGPGGRSVLYMWKCHL